jgi:hypothetical protein
MLSIGDMINAEYQGSRDKVREQAAFSATFRIGFSR